MLVGRDLSLLALLEDSLPGRTMRDSGYHARHASEVVRTVKSAWMRRAGCALGFGEGAVRQPHGACV